MTLDRSEFRPHKANVIDITNAQRAVVTFDDDHNFVENEIVSFRVSKPYGMVEINNLQGKVLEITSDTITVDIDTSFFNAFIYPPSGTVQYLAMAVPVGSGIEEAIYFPTVIIKDSFDNVPLT